MPFSSTGAYSPSSSSNDVHLVVAVLDKYMHATEHNLLALWHCISLQNTCMEMNESTMICETNTISVHKISQITYCEVFFHYETANMTTRKQTHYSSIVPHVWVNVHVHCQQSWRIILYYFSQENYLWNTEHTHYGRVVTGIHTYTYDGSVLNSDTDPQNYY